MASYFILDRNKYIFKISINIDKRTRTIFQNSSIIFGNAFHVIQKDVNTG